jgi:hypothetical protein
MDRGQKQRSMGAAGFLLMLCQDEVVFDDRHTLPGRGRFNR